MLKYKIQRVLVIGLGLIGGSFAKALKSRRLVEEVLGYDRNLDDCHLGVRLGVIDRVAEDLPQALSTADLVVLAVPVKVMEQVLVEVAPHLSPKTLLTDVGSTKLNIIQAAERVLGRLPSTFIPGHPIAGAEKSGVRAADADLFERHKVILTPTEASDSEATLQIARLWQAVGAEVLQMDPARHDQVLAATSHLPHMLAFSLVDTLAHEEENRDIFRYAAGGFRDFTRIAASDPVMWHDICQANRDALLKQIDQFSAGLGKLRQAIATGDSQSLLGIFTRARVAREHFSRLLAGSAYSHSNQAIDLKILPGSQLQGELQVPGDRSISHRAVVLAALAEGVSDLYGFLEGEDSLATLQALRDMGVVIEGPHQGHVRIYGVGLQGLQPAPGPLYLGHSIVSMRLLMGILAAQPFASELCGDEALNQASMESVMRPLRAMGAWIESAENFCPPIRITPVAQLLGRQHRLPQASAQVKSALLLAGLYAQGSTQVLSPGSSRDHTERLLSAMEYPLEQSIHEAQERVALLSEGALKPLNLDIPGDFMAALALVVAALITPQATLRLKKIGVNPTRTQAFTLLQRMGAKLELHALEMHSGEPVAEVRVSSSLLQGISLSAEESASLGDNLLFIVVAAMHAQSASELIFAKPLSSAQIAGLEQLQRLGAKLAWVDAKHLQITPAALKGGEIKGELEANIQLALVVAAVGAEQEVRLQQAQILLTAFPELIEQAQSAGLRIHKESD